jgi:hypothetical protein
MRPQLQVNCGVTASVRPDVVPASQAKVESLPDGKPFSNRLNFGDFEINRQFQLGSPDGKPFSNRLNSGDFEINRRVQLDLQLCGSRRHNGAILGGMLKLNVNPMRKMWTKK